jgi:hypothetical protein
LREQISLAEALVEEIQLECDAFNFVNKNVDIISYIQYSLEPFALDNDPSLNVNWFKTNFFNSKFRVFLTHQDDLEIKLVLTEYLDGIPQDVTYEIGNGIEDVRVFVENQTVSISFKLLEKNGDHFQITLRRSKQNFGIIYVGKVKKFSQGVFVRRGMMKLVLQESELE